LSVTVPERFAGLLRRRSGRTGELSFIQPPPQPRVHLRDPRRALDFVGISNEPGAPSPDRAAADDLAARVASMSWYHTIELPDGIVTPGRFDHRPLVGQYGLPDRMDGQSALDVATFDGFWAFEMERRGATVTAVDVDSTRDLDYPDLVQPLVRDIADMPAIGAGFRLAHEALGSAVERIGCSVYDLAPHETGMFDFVHCGDLLLHMRDPLTALARMRSVCRGRLLLSDSIDLDAPPVSAGPTVRYLGGWDDVVWWLPSLDALAQMVVDAGFRDVRVNAVYQLAKTYDEQGLWRASLHAEV
jgi:tRNA (mo5U34)-methyltransferase